MTRVALSPWRNGSWACFLIQQVFWHGPDGCLDGANSLGVSCIVPGVAETLLVVHPCTPPVDCDGRT